MKIPQRVVWAEGMLISPHHLQQSDLYHERLLDQRLAAITPWSWGVAAMEIDVGALSGGQLRLVRFTGVLPDGLLVGFEGGDPEAPAARAIEGHFPPTQPVLEVFLAVPLERETGVSVSRPGANGAPVRTRFIAVERTVSDVLGEAAEIDASFAQRNVSILFGGEPREDFRTIKIAEIVRDSAGALVVNDVYVPPLLRVGASPMLTANLRRLLSQLVARQRQLSEQRRQRDASTVEFAAHDVTRYLLLQTLNTAIPLLAQYDRSPEVRPFDLYVALAQLAGQLSTFAIEDDLARIPPFSFTDLRSSFEELFALVTSLLLETVRDGHLSLPLQISQGVFVGRLDDERFLRCQQFVLAVKAQDIPEEQVSQRLPALCKVASWNDLSAILGKAVSGVAVQLTRRPPAEIPVKAGTSYFLLDVRGEHWRTVLKERTVGIYLAPPFDPTKLKVELVGVPAKTS